VPAARGDGREPTITVQTLPWQVHTASAIGAGHVKDGRPNQDAVGRKLAARPDGSAVLAVAVADGHGDPRHFRSDRGAAMAIAAAISAVLAWSASISAAPAAIRLSAEDTLVPDIVARWNAAVAADLSEDPFSDAERAAHAELALPAEIAYGSTLLLAAFTADYAVFAQIGDGNVVAVLPDGQSLSPVPEDSSLDGWRTTSLCQPDAVAAFRVGVVQLAASPLFAVLVATDGFGNAQAEDPWQPGLAADLVRLGLEHDQDWFTSQVPGWAALCASSDGSGDDSTVALVINSAAALNRPAPRPDHRGQLHAKTIPARTLELFPTSFDQSATEDLPRVDPAPGHDASGGGNTSGGSGGSRGTGRPRSLTPTLITVVIAAVVILGLALAFVLRGHGQPRPRPAPQPAHSASRQPSPSSPASRTPSSTASPAPSSTASLSPSPPASSKASSPASPKASSPGSPKPGLSASSNSSPGHRSAGTAGAPGAGRLPTLRRTPGRRH
jgi:Protein phosphatase 2C